MAQSSGRPPHQTEPGRGRPSRLSGRRRLRGRFAHNIGCWPLFSNRPVIAPRRRSSRELRGLIVREAMGHQQDLSVLPVSMHLECHHVRGGSRPVSDGIRGRSSTRNGANFRAPGPATSMRLMRHGTRGPATLPLTHNRTACCKSSSAFNSSNRPVRALPASVLINASAIGSIP